MATTNEELLDAAIRRQLRLLRRERRVGRELIDLLEASESDLVERIRARVRVDPSFSAAAVRRLQRMELIVRQVRGEAWAEVGRRLEEEARSVARDEVARAVQDIEDALPVVVALEVPTQRQLDAIVRSRPFEGRVLRDWARHQEQVDIDRITAQVRIGAVQGEDAAAVARRVRGVFPTSRQEATALARTALLHTSNQARQQMALDNATILDQELFVATLDGRTSDICKLNDGTVHALGEGPIPPLHFRCRSTRTGLIAAEAVGRRPMKPVTERMLAREFSNGQHSSRGALPFGSKGAFDTFARARVRELVGTVPAKTTYFEFFGRQSAAFQLEELGPTRFQLFRKGNVPFSELISPQGRRLTLSELASRKPDAFRAAGLRPEDF